MTPEDRSRLRQLLTQQRLLALGVVVDGEPVVGVLPYAVVPDFSALLVQASRLARHSQGLKAGGRWSGVIHEPVGPESDVLQVPRLAMEGEVAPVTASDPDSEALVRAFVGRIPGAATTLALPDFGLYRLAIAGGRLVLGFGSALNLSQSHFTDLAQAGPAIESTH